MKPTLAGVPQLLRYLGTFPSPADVVTSLIRGPYGHAGARAVALSIVAPTQELVIIASAGFTREEEDRYRIFPLSIDAPSTLAVRQQRIVHADLQPFGAELMDGLDEPLWRAMVERLGGVSVVSTPIIHRDTSVGVVAAMLDRPWEEGSLDEAIVSAATAALALWMAHPQSGVRDLSVPANREWSLAFTARQRQILRLVEDGRSNPAIAAELGTSESTVKADLQQAMRALRTSDRREAAQRARRLGLV